MPLKYTVDLELPLKHLQKWLEDRCQSQVAVGPLWST